MRLAPPSAPLSVPPDVDRLLRPLRSGRRWGFSPAQWWHLGGFYTVIALLHLAGWGLYLHYAAAHPALVGLGFAAYMLGLRHAFDADHIAAVDDTVRLLVQRGQRPLGVGFFFSLGHASVVFMLALAVIFAAGFVQAELPLLQRYGHLIGTGVSGAFLCLIGLLNLAVLLEVLKLWRGSRAGVHTHPHLETVLARRGWMNRLLGQGFKDGIRHSAQMYPLGFLFGLGFDTASEIVLLAMTAGAMADMPPAAVLSLPLLFTAGMSLMDTSDGVLMCGAYDWALVNPLRKVFYNLSTTALSVVVALLIGTVELAQMLVSLLQLQGPLAQRLAELDFGLLGYLIVAIFVLAWGLSAACWKFGRFEQREEGALVHRHGHAHEDGRWHVHEHLH